MRTKPVFLLLCLLAAAFIFSPALWGKGEDVSLLPGLPSGLVVQVQTPAQGAPPAQRPAPRPLPPPPGISQGAPQAEAPAPFARGPVAGRGQVSPPPAGGLVQMQFDNIELRDLIRFVSNIMGKNFVYDEAVVRGRVTVLSPRSLTKEEVFRVFESVLNYFGFTVLDTPEAYKIVRSADAKGMAVPTTSKSTLGEAAPEERIETLVYPLEYTDSNSMVGILRPLMSRDAYLVSVPTANSLIMIDTASNLQRLQGLLGKVDVPVSQQLSGIEVYNVQHTNAADLAKALQGLLAEGKKAQTGREKIFITSYTPSNSLLISAPPEEMKEIRRIVAEIDTFRPQVLVEAAIIEMSLNKSQTLGVEWLIGGAADGNKIIGGNIISTDSASGGALVPLASGIASNTPATALGALKSGLNIGVIGSNINIGGISFPSIQSFVQAVAADSRTNVLSTPQLLTLNNEEAEMLVGSNIPYTTSTRLDSAGNPITNFDYRDVGVKLKVKPYINRDGLVYLNIFTEITQVTSTLATVGTGQQPAPTTTKRSVKTTVGVKDAQTIVISGIISDTLTDNQQGIPLLRSIPIIGNLFNYSSKADNKTNLLVFLTPKIVYDPKELQKISDEKKSQQEKLLTPQGTQ